MEKAKAVFLRIRGYIFKFYPGAEIEISGDYIYVDEISADRDNINSADYKIEIDLENGIAFSKHCGTLQGCIWTEPEKIYLNGWGVNVL